VYCGTDAGDVREAGEYRYSQGFIDWITAIVGTPILAVPGGVGFGVSPKLNGYGGVSIACLNRPRPRHQRNK